MLGAELTTFYNRQRYNVVSGRGGAKSERVHTTSLMMFDHHLIANQKKVDELSEIQAAFDESRFVLLFLLTCGGHRNVQSLDKHCEFYARLVQRHLWPVERNGLGNKGRNGDGVPLTKWEQGSWGSLLIHSPEESLSQLSVSPEISLSKGKISRNPASTGP